MQSDPASLVPILATPEGRQELQIGSLANTVPNMLDQMQKNGSTFLDAVGVVAPLFKQIGPQALVMMPLRAQPDLLWAWWLATNDAVSDAKNDWVGVDPKRMGALGFGWAWSYGMAKQFLKKDQSLLHNHVNGFIEHLPLSVQRSVWALSQAEDVDYGSADYRKIQKAWRQLVKTLDVPLNTLSKNWTTQLPLGSSVALVETFQKASQSDIFAFLDKHKNRNAFVYRDFMNHEDVLQGLWESPVGGFALLADSGLLPWTSLPKHPDVAPIMDMVDSLGLSLSDPATVRQLITTLVKTPISEMAIPPDVFEL